MDTKPLNIDAEREEIDAIREELANGNGEGLAHWTSVNLLNTLEQALDELETARIQLEAQRTLTTEAQQSAHYWASVADAYRNDPPPARSSDYHPLYPERSGAA